MTFTTLLYLFASAVLGIAAWYAWDNQHWWLALLYGLALLVVQLAFWGLMP